MLYNDLIFVYIYKMATAISLVNMSPYIVTEFFFLLKWELLGFIRLEIFRYSTQYY